MESGNCPISLCGHIPTPRSSTQLFNYNSVASCTFILYIMSEISVKQLRRDHFSPSSDPYHTHKGHHEPCTCQFHHTGLLQLTHQALTSFIFISAHFHFSSSHLPEPPPDSLDFDSSPAPYLVNFAHLVRPLLFFIYLFY